MQQMDWGGVADQVSFGNIKAAEVEGADAFVLISPQNIIGQSILPFLQEMVRAHGRCAALRWLRLAGGTAVWQAQSICCCIDAARPYARINHPACHWNTLPP